MSQRGGENKPRPRVTRHERPAQHVDGTIGGLTTPHPLAHCEPARVQRRRGVPGRNNPWTPAVTVNVRPSKEMGTSRVNGRGVSQLLVQTARRRTRLAAFLTIQIGGCALVARRNTMAPFSAAERVLEPHVRRGELVMASAEYGIPLSYP